MLEAIITEIDLCQRLGETELADVFQAEKDKIEKQNLSCGPAALVCFKNVWAYSLWPVSRPTEYV